MQVFFYVVGAFFYTANAVRELHMFAPVSTTAAAATYNDLTGLGLRTILVCRAAVSHAIGTGGIPPSWFMPAFKFDILSPAVPFVRAWNYPPTMGLLAMPFAFAPLIPSFWIWRVFSFKLVAAGWLLRRARLGWLVIIMGLFSPAALHDFCSGGQNGMLLGGVLVAALLMADRRPKAAGVLAGLLAVKPQIAIVFPFMVARRSRVKLLLAGIVTALGFVMLSWIVLGPEPWWFFFNVARPDEFRSDAAPYLAYFPAYSITIFYMARGLGAAVHTAWCLQAISSVVSLVLVYLAWKPGRMPPVPRMALTCCLAVLSTPHGYNYDLVGWSVGIAALFPAANALERLILALLWMAGGYCVVFFYFTNLVLFPPFAALGAIMAWRLRTAPAWR